MHNSRPPDTPKNAPKSVPTPAAGGALLRSNKTHLAYWEEAIFQRRPGGNWWMILQHEGQRRKLSLATPIRPAAAARARDIYLSILANGWEATLETLRPERPARTEATIGQFLTELATKADIKPKTLEGYAIAFRNIVADVFGIDGGTEKYDHRSGGRAKWIERIRAVRLDAVTPARVQEWKRIFIGRAGEDPIGQRSARTSFNSYLRRAKSLFAPDNLKHLSITLPSPLPFEGITFEPRQSTRYRSNIDAAKLTKAAQKELAPSDPPVFLAFLLALGAGLRRIEIDRLEWRAFQWNHNVIRIEPTEYFDVKTEHSIGDVSVDPELLSVFRGYAARATSNFVLPTPNLPIKNATFDNYRAQPVWKRLSAWLKQHGVTARKPIHELRKEFGSMVNRKHGLTAAKDLLRHGDIGVTAGYYIDRPRKATSGLGALLATKRKGKKIVEFGDAARHTRRQPASREESARSR